MDDEVTEVIWRKDYLPGWSWPSKTIDPLNPGNAPLYQMPVECRVIGYKVTDKVVSLATGTQIDSTDQSKNYGDDLKHVVAELPAGQVRQIYWWIRLPN